MIKKYAIVIGTMFLFLGIIRAQETFPVNDVQDVRSQSYALTNAKIFLDYQTVIDQGTLLIKNGKVINSGKDITVPPGYVIVDLKGKWIYPGLVESFSTYGMPKEERGAMRNSFSGAEQILSDTKGPYNANEAIKSEFDAVSVFEVMSKDADPLRKLGFSATQTLRRDGLARGTSALVALGEGTANEMVLNDKVGAHYSFAKGTSSQNYPISTMGFIALLRQTHLDAQWYKQFKVPPFTDKSLDSWNATQTLPQFFEATDWKTVLRADKLGDEFGVQYIIKTDGDSYKHIQGIKATGASLIVPVNFPDPFDVSDIYENHKFSLADLKHWEMAPGNLAALEKAGISFAITSNGLAKTTEFWPNLRKAITAGLTTQTALKALTIIPAKLIGEDTRLGHLKPGAVANLLITSGDLFGEETQIHENWILGERYEINPLESKLITGNFKLIVDDIEYALELNGKSGKLNLNDTTKTDVSLIFSGDILTLNLTQPQKTLTGWQEGKDLKGTTINKAGQWSPWSATFLSEVEEKEKKEPKKEEQAVTAGIITYPFGAYGMETLPVQEEIIFKNATVWTMEEGDQVMEATDVWINKGKITGVGKNLTSSTAKVIDATGMHLTPGIIDEHSHIGAASINDVATNSGMVRIGDVLDSEDQEIYRALSGGVTAVQVLHGSANPIGGQSALIKLRWGHTPEELKIEGADGFIKFALGENVKRSGNPGSVRFPQSRMGVEQVYVDAFTSALDYQKEWDVYNKLNPMQKKLANSPRRDLALETMSEILNKKRFISCHSYVQTEINMLMKVAERFNFKVNTFTHILEGYKVADKMAKHGVGGSTFSDWWNYKWEVRYAISYNAAIMHREGVVTAINSDDAEMMRRLNQEAAKVVKYGGISEWDALKMVTINPAKLLHLEQKMGSIKVGKDADLVLWSDHPLSIYAVAQKTLVDGKIFFDVERDQKLREEVAKERVRLIEKMKNAKCPAGRTAPGRPAFRHHFHCDDIVHN
jgi:imidazolonepropionase-like amidohydrolase